MGESETIEQPFKYVGQLGVFSEDDGLYYMRARYYDAEVGRFISEDPIGFQGGLNLYAYVGGNPVSLVDPSGLGPTEGGKQYFAENERQVERMTGNSTIKWRGINSVKWASTPIDDIVSLIIKKPIPGTSINKGIERGHRIYEFETGTQIERYSGDGFGSRDVHSIASPKFSGNTVWHKGNADRTIHSRTRYQLCVGGSCITY